MADCLVTTFGLKGDTGSQGPQGIQGPAGTISGSAKIYAKTDAGYKAQIYVGTNQCGLYHEVISGNNLTNNWIFVKAGGYVYYGSWTSSGWSYQYEAIVWK